MGGDSWNSMVRVVVREGEVADEGKSRCQAVTKCPLAPVTDPVSRNRTLLRARQH